jgi:hypothetical protein
MANIYIGVAVRPAHELRPDDSNIDLSRHISLLLLDDQEKTKH